MPQPEWMPFSVEGGNWWRGLLILLASCALDSTAHNREALRNEFQQLKAFCDGGKATWAADAVKGSTATAAAAPAHNPLTSYIAHLQSPAQCQSTYYLWRPQFWGLGSNILGMLNCFLFALSAGRLFVLLNQTNHYANALSCPTQGYDCYFQPLTKCSAFKHSTWSRTGMDDPGVAVFYGSQRAETWSGYSRLLARIPHDHEVHRIIERLKAQESGRRHGIGPQYWKVTLHDEYWVAWLKKEVLQYLVRPNARLLDLVRVYRGQLNLTDPYVSVHLRTLSRFSSKTDVNKFKKRLRPVADYAAAACIACEGLGAARVFVSADDPRAVPRFASALPCNATVAHIPFSDFPSARVKKGTKVETFLDAVYNKNPTHLKDEGLVTMANVMLMAAAAVNIGGCQSNMHQLVGKLMWRDTQPPCQWSIQECPSGYPQMM